MDTREVDVSSLWPSPEDDAHLDDDEPGPEPEYLSRLKHLINLVDRAMGDEGVPARVRDRVVARVLHGTPTPDAPADWAEPEPHDRAVLDMLADAAPACVRSRPTWDVPPVNG